MAARRRAARCLPAIPSGPPLGPPAPETHGILVRVVWSAWDVIRTLWGVLNDPVVDASLGARRVWLGSYDVRDGQPWTEAMRGGGAVGVYIPDRCIMAWELDPTDDGPEAVDPRDARDPLSNIRTLRVRVGLHNLERMGYLTPFSIVVQSGGFVARVAHVAFPRRGVPISRSNEARLRLDWGHDRDTVGDPVDSPRRLLQTGRVEYLARDVRDIADTWHHTAMSIDTLVAGTSLDILHYNVAWATWHWRPVFMRDPRHLYLCGRWTRDIDVQLPWIDLLQRAQAVRNAALDVQVDDAVMRLRLLHGAVDMLIARECRRIAEGSTWSQARDTLPRPPASAARGAGLPVSLAVTRRSARRMRIPGPAQCSTLHIATEPIARTIDDRLSAGLIVGDIPAGSGLRDGTRRGCVLFGRLLATHLDDMLYTMPDAPEERAASAALSSWTWHALIDDGRGALFEHDSTLATPSWLSIPTTAAMATLNEQARRRTARESAMTADQQAQLEAEAVETRWRRWEQWRVDVLQEALRDAPLTGELYTVRPSGRTLLRDMTRTVLYGVAARATVRAAIALGIDSDEVELHSTVWPRRGRRGLERSPATSMDADALATLRLLCPTAVAAMDIERDLPAVPEDDIGHWAAAMGRRAFRAISSGFTSAEGHAHVRWLAVRQAVHWPYGYVHAVRAEGASSELLEGALDFVVALPGGDRIIVGNVIVEMNELSLLRPCDREDEIAPAMLAAFMWWLNTGVEPQAVALCYVNPFTPHTILAHAPFRSELMISVVRRYVLARASLYCDGVTVWPLDRAYEDQSPLNNAELGTPALMPTVEVWRVFLRPLLGRDIDPIGRAAREARVLRAEALAPDTLRLFPLGTDRPVGARNTVLSPAERAANVAYTPFGVPWMHWTPAALDITPYAWLAQWITDIPELRADAVALNERRTALMQWVPRAADVRYLDIVRAVRHATREERAITPIPASPPPTPALVPPVPWPPLCYLVDPIAFMEQHSGAGRPGVLIQRVPTRYGRGLEYDRPSRDDAYGGQRPPYESVLQDDINRLVVGAGLRVATATAVTRLEPRDVDVVCTWAAGPPATAPQPPLGDGGLVNPPLRLAPDDPLLDLPLAAQGIITRQVVVDAERTSAEMRQDRPREMAALLPQSWVLRRGARVELCIRAAERFVNRAMMRGRDVQRNFPPGASELFPSLSHRSYWTLQGLELVGAACADLMDMFTAAVERAAIAVQRGEPQGAAWGARPRPVLPPR